MKIEIGDEVLIKSLGITGKVIGRVYTSHSVATRFGLIEVSEGDFIVSYKVLRRGSFEKDRSYFSPEGLESVEESSTEEAGE